MLRQVELIEKVKSYDPNVEEELLNKAYVFSMRAHGSQKRASGDPYFSHPLEVAGILADHKFDSKTIITALLHDVVEDTTFNLLDIKTNFGNEISCLVDGVTKLSNFEGRSDKFNQAENFRKLLLATSRDIRVLFVKLADRLHNMRTLRFIKDKNKRKRISFETLEIYSPLAERLGMDEIRKELDDLSFQTTEPELRGSIIQRLSLLRQQDEDVLDKIVKNIEDFLIKQNINFKVFGREKTPYSIWKKMKVKSVNFSQLSDIMAFTILVDDTKICYAVLGLLHQFYSYVPGRFKDYISTPKPNGYQSIHTTLIGPLNQRIEIQIRTFEMNEKAEFGIAAHWIYKDKININDGKQYRWMRQILDIIDQSNEPEEFLEHTKMQMHADQVFVFTPKGDLVALPNGAMPLDFAFSVHSDIGSSCIGVKINNSIKQLNTKLKNGDQVEIICGEQNTLSTKWLDLSITGKARAYIKKFLQIKEDEDFKKLGKEILVNQFKIQKMRYSERNIKTVLDKLKIKNLDDLYKAIGNGKIPSEKIISSMFPEKKLLRKDDKIILFNKLRDQKENNRPVILKGLTPGMSIHFANCCNPIPGDDAIAFIMEGKGLLIHQFSCEELKKSESDSIEKIKVSWENLLYKKNEFVGKINVTIKNKIGSLGVLSSIIAKSLSNIRNLKITERNNDFYKINIDIDVKNKNHLSKVIVSLRASEFIDNVSRV
ncbi:MAG: bifunctional (p)ppGpp synthetase/guanosine-3',5'-bis(diphosphate) 3'-pyrophosphohydrolase [Pelagibacteraceae bacterium TMED65]|nr:bifunctional (p)ppGpp synthetase/guanosine-3',5'-bis(diphosphate) 3'-pyrophosphohydrolase [Rickettsiales bacterium]OUU52766.1 MAG: bifunctional (p)ppGpp synthetase/guanosine-3',5'-bis(diphosphate) 3'-pyrophosphohydrolase [Pelagibacteraceae bacterium TMED65]